MRAVAAEKSQVAYCGLYCGACKAFRKGKCPGCRENEKATWCRIRSCCSEHGLRSCADCTIVGDLHDCGKFNNMISKIFAIIFRSDRFACIQAVREKGYPGYAEFMAESGRHSIKRS